MKSVRGCRIWLAGGLLACLVSAAAAQEGLARKVEQILAEPSAKPLRAGVCIRQVKTGRTLCAIRADELFIPASNMKLLTTAAALDHLGGDFTFLTTFALRGGDLLVFASGDPGLGDERLAKRREQPIEAAFLRVAAALRQAGVQRIGGDLIVDATVFDAEYFHPSWPANQRDQWYEAEVAGFNFNDNCIDIRLTPPTGGPSGQDVAAGAPAGVELSPNTRYVTIVNKAVGDPAKHLVWFQRQGVSNTIHAGGSVQKRMWTAHSVPIHNPPAFAAQVLVDVLAGQQISLAGKVRFERLRRPDGSLPPGLTVLARHEQPIGELVWRTNTFSQNFVAECLFKALGAYENRATHPAGQGSWATGRKAVLDFCRRSGLNVPAGLVVDDGSGLSKANQLSPALLAELLVKMADHRLNEMWFDSLASGGGDGTLRKRFRALDGGEMVLAKTGTLANAIALSGYVRTKAGNEYAFSILFDKLRGGQTSQARLLADKIVATIVNCDAASAGRAEKAVP